MASTALKGITIKINGDVTKLNSALDGVDLQTRSLSKNLKQVESILD